MGNLDSFNACTRQTIAPVHEVRGDTKKTEGQSKRSLCTDVVEWNLGAGLLSSRDDEFEHFARRFCLLSLAVLACILLLDGLAGSGALWTLLLRLLHHARSDSVHDDLDTLSLAARAFLDGAFLLRAFAFASRAQDLTLHFELLGATAIEILQRQADLMLHVRGAGGLLATAATASAEHAATEELREHIVGVVAVEAAAAAGALLQTLLTVLQTRTHTEQRRDSVSLRCCLLCR